MPVDLSSISEEDRQDFENRLKVYGLDLSVVQEPLVVMPSTEVSLAYGPGRESVRNPVVLHETDFRVIKRMIGVDDAVFKKTASQIALPRRIELGLRKSKKPVLHDKDSREPFYTASPCHDMDDADDSHELLSKVDLRSLDNDGLSNVRIAARAFIRGNSQVVSSYRPIMEKVIGRITIPVWPLLKIKVSRGSVLEFGPGVNVLVAHELEIEEGGTVRSRGHLTLSCTLVRKPGKSVKIFAGAFKPIYKSE